MTIFQKALYGGQVAEYMKGHDRVAGYVLRAADTVQAPTPSALFDAHGLGFVGSPWDRNAAYLDVLRFQGVPANYVHDAVAPEFSDHAPFNGTGFTASGTSVFPLYFLDEVRLPPGAEMWRITGEEPDRLLAVYLDVATGWRAIDDSVVPSQPQRVPSPLTGWTAVWEGRRFIADRKPSGDEAVLACETQPVGLTGFTTTPRGLWSRTTPIKELADFFELNATCDWSGQPFKLLDSFSAEGKGFFRLFYVGHKADTAERLQLNKSDAGVYWTIVEQDAVQNLRFVQNRFAGLLDRADADV